MPRIKSYPKGVYDVSALWQLCQCDLAFVPKPLVFNSYVGFLLLIDCFSVSKSPAAPTVLPNKQLFSSIAYLQGHFPRRHPAKL
jgi:hypothetical protein